MKKTIYFLLMTLLSALFLYTGIVKLQDNPIHWAVFQQAGYSKLFFHIIGLIEILLAAGLWWPITKRLTLLGMGAIMLGAIGTHIKSSDAAWHYMVPVVVLILAGILWQRR
jgi:putative oxidoreductase